VRVESLPFQRRFKQAGEGKTGEDSPCVEGKEVPVSLVFTREVGRKSGRSHVLQYPVVRCIQVHEPFLLEDSSSEVA
jgi:hypothetical protein